MVVIKTNCRELKNFIWNLLVNEWHKHSSFSKFPWALSGTIIGVFLFLPNFPDTLQTFHEKGLLTLETRENVASTIGNVANSIITNVSSSWNVAL